MGHGGERTLDCDLWCGVFFRARALCPPRSSGEAKIRCQTDFLGATLDNVFDFCCDQADSKVCIVYVG